MGISETLSGLGLDSVLEKPQYLPQIPNWEDCEVRPNLPIHESSTTIQFVVGGQNDPNFTIPSTMQLCGVVEIRKQDGTNIVLADDVSMVNLFPHALFEAVDIFINNKQISDTGRNYHHKAYITNNFSFSDGAKTKALNGDFFLQNTLRDKYEIPDPQEQAGRLGASFVMKKSWVCKDKIRFSIPFVWDMASTPYIAPGIEIKIVFHKNRFNVPLLARDNDLQLKINFRDAKLRMRRFTLNEPAPQVLDYYFTKKQYYPINRVQMRMRTLPHGSSNIIIPQIVNGQIPWHLFCVLLKKEQQNDLNKDPFSYETHGIRDFTLLKNGFSVPSQPLVVDDASTDGEGKITTYKHFGSNMGFTHQHHNLGPSISEYFVNQFVMAYNLCGDGCVGGHDHISEYGSLDLRINLNQPADNLELLIMGVFENVLTIEKGIPEIDYST